MGRSTRKLRGGDSPLPSGVTEDEVTTAMSKPKILPGANDSVPAVAGKMSPIPKVNSLPGANVRVGSIADALDNLEAIVKTQAEQAQDDAEEEGGFKDRIRSFRKKFKAAAEGSTGPAPTYDRGMLLDQLFAVNAAVQPFRTLINQVDTLNKMIQVGSADFVQKSLPMVMAKKKPMVLPNESGMPRPRVNNSVLPGAAVQNSGKTKKAKKGKVAQKKPQQQEQV